MILLFDVAFGVWVLLAIAMALDWTVGETPFDGTGLSHPIVWIGRLIGRVEAALNDRTVQRGVVALALILIVVFLVTLGLVHLPLSWLVIAVCAAILLAHRALIDHVARVAQALDQGLEQGQAAVAHIVGRDTSVLDGAGVSRAAVESAAENFSDGVVAPVFWFVIAGLPGMALYKAVNTADSMIGHRTERYQAFGWAAARLDDVMNWVPARLTAILFLTVGLSWTRVRTVLRDAPQHKSVNAGWPEAAMAVSLNIALAGPRVYGGAAVPDPYMNAAGRIDLDASDIRGALRMLSMAWGLLFCLVLALAVLV